MIRLILKICAGLAVLALIGIGMGCGTLGNRGPSIDVIYTKNAMDKGGPDIWPEKSLRNAFSRYWALRFEGDIDAMWEMEAPYIQEMADPDRYHEYMRNTGRNKLKDIEMIDIVQKNDYLAEIQVNVYVEKRNDDTEEVYLKDEWVKAGGQWYHLLRDKLLFPYL